MPFQPKKPAPAEPMRGYNFRLPATYIERATALAKKLNTDTADIVRQALHDQLFGLDAEEILSRKR